MNPTQHPHLGELIEATLKEMGMSKAEFGRRIRTSRQNVSLILKKKTLDSELIWRIGKVFGEDFFHRLSMQFSGHDLYQSGDNSNGNGKLEMKLTISNQHLALLTAEMVRNLTGSDESTREEIQQ